VLLALGAVVASQVDAALGLYALADRIRAGHPSRFTPDGSTTPRLPLRLVDTGAVGFDDDPAAYESSDDYSLNTDVAGPAVLADARVRRWPWTARATG
jgi:hypothetical protein